MIVYCGPGNGMPKYNSSPEYGANSHSSVKARSPALATHTCGAVAARRLEMRSFDCAMEPDFVRRRTCCDVSHVQAPNANICFNFTPADTAEAVQLI